VKQSRSRVFALIPIYARPEFGKALPKGTLDTHYPERNEPQKLLITKVMRVVTFES